MRRQTTRRGGSSPLGLVVLLAAAGCAAAGERALDERAAVGERTGGAERVVDGGLVVDGGPAGADEGALDAERARAGGLAAGGWQPAAGAPAPAAVREALWRGMDYMVRSALVREHFHEFDSDYLFFFADVARMDDPWIAWQARLVGRALGGYYLEHCLRTDSPGAIVDATSALWALEQLGLDIDAPLAVLQRAARQFDREDYLEYAESAGGLPDLDLLIDLVIGFHFTDRMGVDIGVSYAEVLPHVAAVAYQIDPDAQPNRLIDVNNLITHLVYTLSGYASWNVPARLLGREREHIRANMAHALTWADTETLAEFVDSLKLMGFGIEDRDVAAGMRLLLALQLADGRWQPAEPQDEYDRYHATWCAMDALRAYRLAGPDRLPDPVTGWVLERWAAARAAGRPLEPWMPVASDPVRGE
jgi:hypothetical protein